MTNYKKKYSKYKKKYLEFKKLMKGGSQNNNNWEDKIKETHPLIQENVERFIFIDLINDAMENPDNLLRIIQNTDINTLVEYIDEQVANSIVEVNGLCLEYLPEHLRNNIHICRTAVNQNNEAFDFVQFDIAMQLNPNVTIFIDNIPYVVDRGTVLTRTFLDNLLIHSGQLNEGERNRCYLITNDVVHLRYPEHIITQEEIDEHSGTNPYITGFSPIVKDNLLITTQSFGGAGTFVRGVDIYNEDEDALRRVWASSPFSPRNFYYSISD